MMMRLIFLQINASYFNLLRLFLRKIELNQSAAPKKEDVKKEEDELDDFEL